jgi:hypothetical protein
MEIRDAQIFIFFFAKRKYIDAWPLDTAAARRGGLRAVLRNNHEDNTGGVKASPPCGGPHTAPASPSGGSLRFSTSLVYNPIDQHEGAAGR